MPRCTLTELEIVEGLRNPEQHDQTLRCLYTDSEAWTDFNQFVGVNRWVRFMTKLLFLKKLQPDEKREAYNDAWIKFDRDIRYPRYNYQLSSWRGFFKQCTKEVWRSYNRNNKIEIDHNRELTEKDISINPIEERDGNQFSLNQMKKMFLHLGPMGEKGLEIYLLILQGYGYPEMADQLGVSQDTIRQRKAAVDRRFLEVYNIELPSITQLRD